MKIWVKCQRDFTQTTRKSSKSLEFLLIVLLNIYLTSDKVSLDDRPVDNHIGHISFFVDMSSGLKCYLTGMHNMRQEKLQKLLIILYNINMVV